MGENKFVLRKDAYVSLEIPTCFGADHLVGRVARDYCEELRRGALWICAGSNLREYSFKNGAPKSYYYTWPSSCFLEAHAVHFANDERFF